MEMTTTVCAGPPCAASEGPDVQDASRNATASREAADRETRAISGKVGDGEPDLAEHHHEIHVRPGGMVLRTGKRRRIAQDEPRGPRSPTAEDQTEQREQGAVPRQD